MANGLAIGKLIWHFMNFIQHSKHLENNGSNQVNKQIMIKC